MFDLMGAPQADASLRARRLAPLHASRGPNRSKRSPRRRWPRRSGRWSSAAACDARDGEWIWVTKRADIVEDRTTRRRRLVGIAVDVTERMREAEISATADQRLRDAIEAISEAFVLWDAGNRLVLCNSKYQRCTNLPPNSARAGALLRRARASRPGRRSCRARSSSIPAKRRPADDRSRTYQARLADGRWLQVNERRTRDGGYVSVGTDITAIKQNEEELQKSERLLLQTVAQLNQSRRSLEAQAQQMAELAKGYHEEKAKAETANRAKAEFLANMGHELRTPLNAIIGFSDMMRTETLGPIAPKYLDYACNIFDSGQSLLKVFDDVLAMSNLESGRIQLHYQKFAAIEAVEAAIADVAEVARDKRDRAARRSGGGRGDQRRPRGGDARADDADAQRRQIRAARRLGVDRRAGLPRAHLFLRRGRRPGHPRARSRPPRPAVRAGEQGDGERHEGLGARAGDRALLRRAARRLAQHFLAFRRGHGGAGDDPQDAAGAARDGVGVGRVTCSRGR